MLVSQRPPTFENFVEWSNSYNITMDYRIFPRFDVSYFAFKLWTTSSQSTISAVGSMASTIDSADL